MLFHEIIEAYYAKHQARLQAGKTTIRSIRLALTPAVKLLKFCDHHGAQLPTRKMIQDYLWCFWGQRNAVYSFVNFLHERYALPMRAREITPPELRSPNESREHLKHRLIAAMRGAGNQRMDADTFLRIAVGYLHGIGVPKGIRLTYCAIKKDREGYFLRLVGHRIHLPKEIVAVAKRYSDSSAKPIRGYPGNTHRPIPTS